MFKYILLTLAVTLGIQYQSGAQEILNTTNRQHIIHLKNGSSIIGVLIDYREEAPAIIEVADGERISVPQASIQSLEPITQKTSKSIIRKSKKEENLYDFPETGWHHGASFGIISRGNGGDGLGLMIDINSAYHFSRLLGLGMSIGYDEYQNNGMHDYIPIQLVVTGYLSPTKTSIYYSLNMGYGINVSDKIEQEQFRQSNSGGFVFNPQVGIRLSGNQGSNMVLFGGIKIQKTKTESAWGENFEEIIIQERVFKRLILGLGFVF